MSIQKIRRELQLQSAPHEGGDGVALAGPHHMLGEAGECAVRFAKSKSTTASDPDGS